MGSYQDAQTGLPPWKLETHNASMPLPELILIEPLAGPVRAEITVPGSKSITNRALILAALADGETTLRGALWSEDTQIMVDCLRQLGFEVAVEPDADEFCNRTITVKGMRGVIPRGGTAGEPLELFVGNAGTVARFLAAFVCLGDGVYRLHGVPRMHERPQAALFQALRELGYRIESENENDKLPAGIFGSGPSACPPGGTPLSRPGGPPRLLGGGEGAATRSCTVSIGDSSQFASALLLCVEAGGWQVKVIGENAEESPYVKMTTKLIEVFPKQGGSFEIEPDASSGSYFLGAAWLFQTRENHPFQVVGWPVSPELQIDAQFTGYWPPPPSISRTDELGDSIMTAIVLAPLVPRATEFIDLGRLRVQECERVTALRTELTRCGARVIEAGDTLTVFPSADKLHGAEIETYHDHRMAMCFAILGLKVAGIKIKNPTCVKKTFPNFFQKLAAGPPRGLGATILDAATGRRLGHEELFAD
ncbi:MAG: 3-phosphoshikimate 1-carboxyvinyltransferase [Limisphaerales bacterium]